MVGVGEFPWVIGLKLFDHILEIVDHLLGLTRLLESIHENAGQFALEIWVSLDIDAQESWGLATLLDLIIAIIIITAGSLGSRVLVVSIRIAFLFFFDLGVHDSAARNIFCP